MTPTIGRIVWYQLTAEDAAAINRRRVQNATRLDEWAKGAIAHIGNKVHAGDDFPAMVVTVTSPTSVNLQVFLDGNDTLWAQEKAQGEAEGQWQWPPRV